MKTTIFKETTTIRQWEMPGEEFERLVQEEFRKRLGIPASDGEFSMNMRISQDTLMDVAFTHKTVENNFGDS